MPSPVHRFQARLVDGGVGRTLLDQALPMLGGLLAMVVLALVDTFFVGQLGTAELAALSFTFPVTLGVASVAVGLGAGVSSVLARALGGSNEDALRHLCTNSLLLSLVLVGVLVAVGHATIDPLFTALGAGADLLPLIRSYMEIWYVAMVFLIVPMVGNGALRAVGSAGAAGGIMMMVAALNVALDPLLIFGAGPIPGLGLEGAAYATLISRAFSLVAALGFLGMRHRLLTLRLPGWRLLWRDWRLVLWIGLPAAATQAIMPVAQGLVTHLVAAHGPAAVAAWGVSIRLEAFAVLAFMALATAMGPFAGQNGAAGRLDRLHQALRLSLRFCWLWGLAAWLILALSGETLAGWFNDHPEVVAQVGAYLRIVPLGYAGLGFAGVIGSAFNGLGLPLAATALTVVRVFGLYVPLAWAGEAVAGLEGLFWGVGLANALAGLLAWPWAHRQCKRQRRRRVEGAP